jgi:hypothetical protein
LECPLQGILRAVTQDQLHPVTIRAVPGEPAVFNGGNFAPNAAVTVTVTEPSGRKHSQVIGVNDDGTLSYQVPISVAGTYEVQIANQTGEVLSKAAVVVSQ